MIRVYAVASLVENGEWSIDKPLKVGLVDDKAQRDTHVFLESTGEPARCSHLPGSPVHGPGRDSFGSLGVDRRPALFYPLVSSRSCSLRSG